MSRYRVTITRVQTEVVEADSTDEAIDLAFEWGNPEDAETMSAVAEEVPADTKTTIEETVE